jgi:hypothetical protein
LASTFYRLFHDFFSSFFFGLIGVWGGMVWGHWLVMVVLLVLLRNESWRW